MAKFQIVNENQLDEWVRSNASLAQGKIVELVYRLVCASCPHPKHRRFPLSDSIGQHGADGELETEIGYLPFVPEGKSVWEIGTGIKARNKANSDYADSIESIPENVRQESTFVFVTPLSGRRDWKGTYEEDGINQWITEKKALGQWKDVIVLDGTKIADWVTRFPAVGHWLASLLGQHPDDFDTAESHWMITKKIGDPPPLIPELFLIGRDNAIEKLKRLVIERTDRQLRLDTKYPNYPKDFVSAFIASLTDDERVENENRILILNSEESWKKACALNVSHVFIADFDLNTDNGPQLIQRATNNGHSVIFSGQPGGMPHGNACALATPQAGQMQEALIKSKYSQQRAMNLVNRSGKDLGSLLRLIGGLSVMPEWATQSESCDLAIAQLLGRWNESCEGDQAVAGEIAGNEYGEWINKIRQASSAKSAPLECLNGRWKFTARYESWLYLGKLVSVDVLKRFEQIAITVLSETNPELDLPKEKRFTAAICGRNRKHSQDLRKGIAETLVLLGSHGNALSACTDGHAKLVADNVVRVLLTGADSVRWASLNDILPMLAEASPETFLDAVGTAGEKPDEPFSGVFAEEDGSVIGRNFATGLLWALESLAWSSDHIVRVATILAELAAVDPGGNYTNRPRNSLAAILLPWFPQTCADAKRRHAAMTCATRNRPDIGWEILIKLLPRNHATSVPTHRPKWRDYIPEDWEPGAKRRQRNEDETFYASLALQLAGADLQRIADLVSPYFLLGDDFQKAFNEHLKSPTIVSIPESERFSLWNLITTKISNYRKYSGSPAWFATPAALENLEKSANGLKPTTPEIYHKRHFSGRDADHYEEKGNWEEQRSRLLQIRIAAVRDILINGGFEKLREFSQAVESPDDAGAAYGAIAETSDDYNVLPAMLESKNEADIRFAKSFVWNRFWKQKWEWVDGLDCTTWSVTAKASFLSILPFASETWVRVKRELAEHQSEYWKRARAIGDKENLQDLDYALEQLIAHGRSDSAIHCLWLSGMSGGRYSEIGLKALETLGANEHVDAHDIGVLFTLLQSDKTVDETRLAKMEFKYLPLLNEFGSAQPVTLHRQLAENSDFFCHIISSLYRSTHEPAKETNDVDEAKAQISQQAYRLLKEWENPPGLKKDGTFDPLKLSEWCAEVKTKCIQSGHWEVASHHIGEVLNFAPKNENDLWIDPVCELLNSKDDDYRLGLRIRIFNSRGAYWSTGGKDETKLADKWEQIAGLAEEKGFIRLGATLRDLASTYREEAKRSSLDDFLHRD